jgi:hypothetical protein
VQLPVKATRRLPWLHAGLAVAAFSAVACSTDHPIAPIRSNDAASLAAAPKKVVRPTITNVVLSSSTLTIGGAGVTYDVTIQNTGSDAAGISIQADLVQGNVTRSAGGSLANCGAGAGGLPQGTCTMTLTAAASNSNPGSGTLTPGTAKLVISLNQTAGTTTTLLDSRTLRVNLTAVPTTPYISNLVLSFTSLVINGTSGDYTVTLQNPTTGDQSLLLVQGYVTQGTAYRGAGGTNVLCGSASGTLPPGTCSFSFTAGVNNSLPGNGALVAGPAVFRLELLKSDGVTTTVLDSREVAIMLTGP